MIALMVAGTASGVGKTTIALALMAALRERGYRVQPFKCGPDFLDAGHHGAICGRPSRNLDTWMLDEAENRAVFKTSIRDADAAIVEGMMGLYDGVASGGEDGSSAQIAKMLGLSVVLVLDAGKSARSIAAVVKGFESLDPEVQFAGIVLNRVGSDRHYRLLETAIRSVTKTPLLGRLPTDPDLAIPERHLGLHTTEETTTAESRLAAFVRAGQRFLDITPLLSLSCQSAVAESKAPSILFQDESRARIGVARDKAFSFYYEDNFDLLRESGAEIVPFSPLADAELPPNLDALYLGGGYPELYADVLSSNGSMNTSIRAFAGNGKPVYAECGGMIYLSKTLATLDGHSHRMAGLLPMEFQMTPGLVQFGYVDVEFIEDCLLGERGTRVRGHSFHCSRLCADSAMATAYRLRYTLSGREELEGYQKGNVLASYVHLHFRADATLAGSLIGAALRAREAEVQR
ncbi:MAG TPA: cobyrinate a,c-diamide synthase [Terracidiphilus sp.]|nr:cobyrinate a,c-diamide synthase [Terracidiphilus sp.]